MCRVCKVRKNNVKMKWINARFRYLKAIYGLEPQPSEPESDILSIKL